MVHNVVEPAIERCIYSVTLVIFPPPVNSPPLNFWNFGGPKGGNNKRNTVLYVSELVHCPHTRRQRGGAWKKKHHKTIQEVFFDTKLTFLGVGNRLGLVGGGSEGGRRRGMESPPPSPGGTTFHLAAKNSAAFQRDSNKVGHQIGGRPFFPTS